MKKIKSFTLVIKIILITCFVNNNYCAQNKIFDSLKLVLKNSTNDTTIVKTLIALSENCELNEIENYAKQGLQICNKYNISINNKVNKIFYLILI